MKSNGKGIALTSLIIIIILTIILFFLVLVVIDTVGNKSSNEEPENTNKAVAAQNDVVKSESIKNETTKNEEKESNTNINTNVNITSNTSNNQNTISNNNDVDIIKINQTVNVDAISLGITVNYVETENYESGFRRANVTINNNNKSDIDGNTLYMLLYNMMTVAADDESQDEKTLWSNANFEENLLTKSVDSGKSVTGYIYWANIWNKTPKYIKIKPATKFNPDTQEFKFATPQYIIIK